MPIRKFDVQTYSVVTGQIRADPWGSWRHIGLTATPATQAVCELASLFFFTGPSTMPLGLQPGWLGYVSNVDQPAGGQRIYAQLLKDDWAHWYDVLRNERPLSVQYVYDGGDPDPAEPLRRLQGMFLFSGDEPPGEGPEGRLGWPFQPVTIP